MTTLLHTVYSVFVKGFDSDGEILNLLNEIQTSEVEWQSDELQILSQRGDACF